MAGYYIKRANREFGPFTVEAIREMQARGGIDGSTPISADKSTWKRFTDFPELMGTAPAPAPAPAPVLNVNVPPAAPVRAFEERSAMPDDFLAPLDDMPRQSRGSQARSERSERGGFESAFNGKLKFRFLMSWVTFAAWCFLKVCFAICLLLLCVSENGSRVLGATMGALGLLSYVTLGLMTLFTLMFLHGVWRSIPKDTARVAPDVAIGLLFAPVWNVYWFFVALIDAVRGLNEGLMQNGLVGLKANKASTGLAISTAICLLLHPVTIAAFYLTTGLSAPFRSSFDFVVQGISLIFWLSIAFIVQITGYSLLIALMAQMKKAAVALNNHLVDANRQ